MDKNMMKAMEQFDRAFERYLETGYAGGSVGVQKFAADNRMHFIPATDDDFEDDFTPKDRRREKKFTKTEQFSRKKRHAHINMDEYEQIPAEFEFVDPLTGEIVDIDDDLIAIMNDDIFGEFYQNIWRMGFIKCGNEFIGMGQPRITLGDICPKLYDEWTAYKIATVRQLEQQRSDLLCKQISIEKQLDIIQRMLNKLGYR